MNPLTKLEKGDTVICIDDSTIKKGKFTLGDKYNVKRLVKDSYGEVVLFGIFDDEKVKRKYYATTKSFKLHRKRNQHSIRHVRLMVEFAKEVEGETNVSKIKEKSYKYLKEILA